MILMLIFILLHLPNVCVKKKEYPGGEFFISLVIFCFLGKSCFILEGEIGPRLAQCSPSLPTVLSDFGVACWLAATKCTRKERVAGSYCHSFILTVYSDLFIIVEVTFISLLRKPVNESSFTTKVFWTSGTFVNCHSFSIQLHYFNILLCSLLY